MPAFAYEALDSEGRATKGLIDADSPRSARSLLRTRGLLPMEVNAVASDSNKNGTPGLSLNMTLWSTRVFGAADLAIWTRQLAGLVTAGLPLERALTALADEAEKPRQQALMASLRAEVNAGSTFAKALGNYSREFSDTYRAVVGAGEQSGHLGQVLESLATDLEESMALRSKLLGAALYPAIVSLVALGIVLFLLGYVVPQVASVFAGSKRALPVLTVAMLAISAWVREYGGWAALALAAGGLLLGKALTGEAFRQRFDAAWLHLPLVGRLARDYNAARFAATLAMLAGAGVPILKALQAAAETLGNRSLRADALDALVQVREGAPLASALAGKKRLPGLLAMFARLGEQTGTLPLMLQRAAGQLGAQVQRRAIAMATLLEPLLIVGMGAVVMLIVLAVLLPIIQLNQLVR